MHINSCHMVIILSQCSTLAGDIVQLGSTTVFRFNHPQEATEMKGSADEASSHSNPV